MNAFHCVLFTQTGLLIQLLNIMNMHYQYTEYLSLSRIWPNVYYTFGESINA